MESNSNINGKDNQMTARKRKRPTYGVLTLKPKELERYWPYNTTAVRKYKTEKQNGTSKLSNKKNTTKCGKQK